MVYRLRRPFVASALLVALLASTLTGVSHATPVAPQDTVVSQLTLDQAPASIVLDASGTYGYTVTYAHGSNPNNVVYKFRLSDMTVDDSMTLPTGANWAAIDIYDDSVYVTTSDDFYELNATSLPDVPDDSVALSGAGGVGMAISWPHAYITQHTSNQVTKVDLTSMTVVGTFTTGLNYPMGITVDDTYAYVVNTNSGRLSRIRMSDLSDAGSVIVGQQPYGVAIDPAQNFVVVPTASAENVSGMLNPPWLVRVDLNTFTVDDTVALPFTWGYGVAVTPDSATAYVTQSRWGNQVAKVALGAQMTLDEPTIAVGSGPTDVAVNPLQPYFYTANLDNVYGRTVTKVSIVPSVATPSVTALSTTSGPLSGGSQVTISGSDLDGATAVHFGGTSANIISGTDDTVLVTVPAAGSAGAQQVTVTTAGGTSTENIQYTYVAAPNPSSMSPTSGPTDGGTTVTITGTDLAGATVTLGGSAVTLDANTGTSIQFTTPASTSGAFAVDVATIGGSASAGGFTYRAPPPPPVPPAPIAPGRVSNVAAIPGESSATVSWQPPASAGSFAISTYQVRATPGGATCLTGRLSCEVTGLTNGTPYRFTVRALSGAGWGAWSEPSPSVSPVKPDEPITLSGDRKGRRIVITGRTTPGAQVQPWLQLGGQRSFRPSATVLQAGPDGTFTWSRRTARAVQVYVTTTSARSETLSIRGGRNGR